MDKFIRLTGEGDTELWITREIISMERREDRYGRMMTFITGPPNVYHVCQETPQRIMEILKITAESVQSH